MDLNRKILYYSIGYGLFLIFCAIFLNQILLFDRELFFMINGISNPFLDWFFMIITYVGSAIFLTLIIIILWFKKQWKASASLIFSLVIDTILLFGLKSIFLRPRPFETYKVNLRITEYDIGYSFPSGHSERAFSALTILNFLYNKKILYVLAVLVAISRIYTGMHYPFDVLIGSLNGILIGMIVLKLPTKKFEKKMKSIYKKIIQRRNISQ